MLEEEIGELTEKQREFVRVVELIDPEKFMAPFRCGGFGHPRAERLSIFKAFVAKARRKNWRRQKKSDTTNEALPRESMQTSRTTSEGETSGSKGMKKFLPI